MRYNDPMWPAHWHSIDGEVVSREEFFRRTTPTQRAFAEKMQGSPTIYASGEEMWADQDAIRIENLGEPYSRFHADWQIRLWDEGNPDAGTPPDIAD